MLLLIQILIRKCPIKESWQRWENPALAEHLGSIVQLPCRVMHSLPQLQLLGIPCALLASLGTCMHTAILTCTHMSTHCTYWCAHTCTHTAILMCIHVSTHCTCWRAPTWVHIAQTDAHAPTYTLHTLTCTHVSAQCTQIIKKQTFKRGFKNCHYSMTKAPKCAHRTLHHGHTPKGYRISTI